MNILDIAIAKKLAGGGGGSGTDNYNDLSNLPKINDTTLSGNKSSSALGLQSEITNDNKLSSDLVDDANKTNKFVTSTEKQTWNSKQNAIDADHKINADYVDDSTSTNKFVTADNKETWNAKQNAIDNSHKLSSDLVDDENHTNKFVTSTEKTTWNNKQNAIDAEHKLSSSLVSFTTAEAAALASGIDSSKVGQISTNQTNILLVQNKVGKNLLNPYTPDVTNYDTGRGITYTNNKDGTWYVAGTSTQNDAYIDLYNSQTVLPWGLKTGDTIKITTNSTKVNIAIIPYTSSGYGSTVAGNASTVGTLTLTSAIKGLLVRFQVGTAGTVTNENVIGMVCHEGAWNQNSDIDLYGAPNYDLTRLESEDRAGLIDVVDGGAKNLAEIPTTQTIDSITFTKDSNEWITSNSATPDGRQWSDANKNVVYSVKAGRYIIYGETASTNTGTIDAYVIVNGSLNQPLIITANSNGTVEVNLTSAGTIGLMYKPYSSNKVRYMICTKAAFGVSNKFVPYRVPIKGVYVRDTAVVCSTTLTTTGIKFTATEKAAYRITATAIYYNSIPLKLVIKYKTNSSANQLPFCSATHADGEDVSLIASGIMSLDVGGEFEVFAQYASSTSNYFYVLVEKIG